LEATTTCTLRAIEASKILQLIIDSDPIKPQIKNVRPISLIELSNHYRRNQENKRTRFGTSIRPKTKRWYEQQEKALVNVFSEDFNMLSINETLVMDKMDELRETGKSETTIGSHIFKYLKTLYKYAPKVKEFRDAGIDYNYLEGLNLPPASQGREGILESEKEILSFCSKVSTYWSTFAYSLLCLGLRPGEGRNMHLSWIRFSESEDGVNEITIPKEINKTHQSRTIPIVKPLKDVLQKWIKVNNIKDIVFPNTLGRIRDESCHGLRKAFDSIERKDLSPHSFRHTWRSWLELKFIGSDNEKRYLGGWSVKKDMLEHYKHSRKLIDYRIDLERRLNEALSFLTPAADVILENLKCVTNVSQNATKSHLKAKAFYHKLARKQIK